MSVLCVVVVYGVTQVHDVVYIVCQSSSSIIRFHATTHQRLTDINVKDLRDPCDVAACELTSQLYVADWDGECIWLVLSEGEDIQRWPPKSSSDTFRPDTLSVTSSRLLVTSRDTKRLMLLDAAGNEVRCIPLPDYMDPLHAVESPSGTFIVSHENIRLNDRCQVSEVNTAGEVLRQFSRSLDWTPHIAVDSQGNILVADFGNGRILLLDAHLALHRVIINEHELNDKRPLRLYNGKSGQLLVGFEDSYNGGIAVFDVSFVDG